MAARLPGSLDDSSVPVHRIQGEKWPGEDRQKAFSLIPDFSKFNCSLKKAIEVSHQFLHQQNKNCPGIMVLNFVFFYDVL